MTSSSFFDWMGNKEGLEDDASIKNDHNTKLTSEEGGGKREAEMLAFSAGQNTSWNKAEDASRIKDDTML